MGRTPGARQKSTSSRSAPTIYDVARAANVSSQTVSRYFNGFQGMRPGTREKVENAARLLNYRPNLTARALSTNRSQRLGALAHELGEVGGGRVVEAASDSAGRAGYLLDIISLDVRNPQSIERAVTLIDQHELAGVVAFAPTEALIATFDAIEFAVPVIVDFDDDDSRSGTPSSSDGAMQSVIVNHLIELGHTRIAYVAGPEGWISARNRLLGLRRALAVLQLTPVKIIYGDWSAASGYHAGLQLANSPEFTAVVVANDQMALGVMRALRDAGRKVPDDISVVGFDDIPEAQFFSPSLTTVRQDFAAHGRDAITRLIRRIEGGDDSRLARTGTHELIPRESTSKARG